MGTQGERHLTSSDTRTQGIAETEPGAPALTLDERVRDIVESIHRTPSHREILYKTLCAVREQPDESALIEIIAAFPEMATEGMPPSAFLDILVKHEALIRYGNDADETEGEEDAAHDGDAAASDPDAAGAPTAPSDPDATPAPADPLAPPTPATYELTEAGARVIEEMAPALRIDALFAEKPRYQGLLLEILTACATPRSLKDVEALCAGREELTQPKIYPSALLDLLERAGGIEWRGGWITTDAGKEAVMRIKP